jgi:hypothetical protein
LLYFIHYLSRLIVIINFIRDKKNGLSLEDFRSLVKEFGDNLINFFGQNIANSWYLHLLLFHIPDQIERFGSIYPYSCSPQERVNGIHSRLFINCILSSNSSKQLLEVVRLKIYFRFFDEDGTIEASQPRAYSKRKESSRSYNEMERKLSLDHHLEAFQSVKKKTRPEFKGDVIDLTL